MITTFFSLLPPASIIAFTALIVSIYTAYKNFLTQFKGRMWFSDRIILSSSNGVPSICLMCSIENSGANPGALEDVKVQITTLANQSSSTFYPIVTKKDYSIYESYTANDWRQFTTLSLAAKDRIETYIFFNPLNNNYHAVAGEMEVYLQVRWYGKNEWEYVGKKVSFTLTEAIAGNWNTSTNIPIQIASDDFMKYRRI